MERIKILAAQLGIDNNDLLKALTHSSFYKNADLPEHRIGSRFIFAGQFAFKGQLAQILFDFVPENGTRLQHILGNLLANSRLNGIFDQLILKPLIRASSNFDINSHKHIFVYAIMGVISQAEENVRRRFIFNFFLNSSTETIVFHKEKNLDFKKQALNLAKALGSNNIQTEVFQQNGYFHFKVIADGNKILSSVKSKSYLYALKKSHKQALIVVSELKYNKFVEETDYLERLQFRISALKESEQKELELKLKYKEEQRVLNIERSNRIKKARDAARKHAQIEAKKLKTEKNRLKELKEKKNAAPISGKKRRFLEDKLK